MSLRKKHAKHTFEDRLPYFLAFLIPMLIMIGVFAGKSIYPFGDKSFLRTDMYHQYAPFFMDFLEKLKHGESLTYAWEIGLGSNYTALIAYYLSSPFNLLLLVSPVQPDRRVHDISDCSEDRPVRIHHGTASRKTQSHKSHRDCFLRHSAMR